MAQPNPPAFNVASIRAEASWLLPYNRKLRNLVSISLRNLSLKTSSPNRKRGKTIDDDALPQTLRSPAKLVALREQKALGHSRSSTDLRALAENAVSDSGGVRTDEDNNGSPIAGKQKQRPQSMAGGSPARPDFQRVRRRSTIEWANATLQKRQERLEHIAQEKTADVFFTLHIHGVEEPIYISETIEKTMNPTFRHIDWSQCGPSITRLGLLIIRVWVRSGTIDSWRALLESTLDLEGLSYIAKSFDALDRRLPQNALLLHLEDGIYTSYTDSLAEYVPFSSGSWKQRSTPSSQQRPLPTSSFDALLRLSKLDDSIQDALATRNRIASDLESLLEANQNSLRNRDAVHEAGDRLKTIEYAQNTVGVQVEKAKKQQQRKRDAIKARRRAIASDNESRKTEIERMYILRGQAPDMRAGHDVKVRAISNQRRRICEELQTCYPIQPIAGKTLAFTIRGLHLPNSEDLDTEPPEVISAALGHVAQSLQLLAFYLHQTLPYPVTPCGSSSSIYDPISLLKTSTTFKTQASEQTLRTYPLFSKGMPRFRFEYAVFLINQNIRVLLESAFNLRILDIRQTLPNLKYLLYVATAGEGELPARKAGGIRGLMHRVASVDSVGSSFSGLTLHENGKPRGAIERLQEISGKAKHASKA